MLYLKKQVNKIFLVNIIIFAFIFCVNISDAEAILYNPGETLNPTCSPLDANCDVKSAIIVPTGSSAGSLVYASSTDTYNTLSIGINGQILKVKDGGLKWSNDEAVQLLGKAGGQVIIGGTEANNSLVIQANSASSGNTSTNTAIKFKVGDSGSTEALSILNNGDISINGDITMAGDIVPSIDNTYSLGSPTKVWRDVYIGPGSLYVNGQKVLQTDASDNVAITADINQSLLIKTFGTGDVELNPSGSGQILLKGDLRLSADKKFVGAVNFDNLNFTENTISVRNLNGGISLTPNGIGGVYVTNGNFGVGTTSPAEKLDISGNIRFSGALMPSGSSGNSGQFLISQGAGIAPQWASFNTANWDTAYNWGNHTGLYDLLGKATSTLSIHETNYNHSLITTALQSELDPIWNSEKGTYALKSEIPVFSNTGDWLGTWQNKNASDFAASTTVFSQWATSGSNISYAGGSVGIGTTTPGAKLHVNGEFRSSGIWAKGSGVNASGQDSLAMGFNANSSGMQSIAIGTAAISSGWWSIAMGYTAKSPGQQSIAIGYEADSTGPGSVAIGNGTRTSALNSSGFGTYNIGLANSIFEIGNGYYDYGEENYVRYNVLTILNNNNIGIGTTTPSEKLDIFGNLKFSGSLLPGGVSGDSGQFLISKGSSAAPQWMTLNTANWDAAYSWGDHASSNYLTSFTELDPVWNSEKNNYALNSTLSSYLNLDQTTPQITLGTFSFSKIKITTGAVDGYVLTSDNDGLASWTPSYNYTLPTSSESILGGVKIGAGLSIDGGGILSSFGSSKWATSTGIIYYNSGNVGIGAPYAPSKLSIYSGDNKDTGAIINLGGYSVNQYESGRIRFTETNMNNSPLYQGAFMHYNGAANALNIGVHNTVDSLQSSDVNAISIPRNTGYIGIGAAIPVSRLQVSGNLAADIITSDVGFDYKPLPAPTAGSVTGVVQAGAGLNTGNYYYRVTYYTAIGETTGTLSPIITTTDGNQQVVLTFPTSTNLAVVGRKIYRTKVGGTNDTGWLVTTIANNTATTYTDSTADTSLSGDSWAGYRPNTTSKAFAQDGSRVMLSDPNTVLLGYQAGRIFTSAGFGTFIGSYSGYSLTYGFANTFVGYASGRAVTTGGSNAFFGSRSGYSLTTGSNNTHIGTDSTQNITTGSNNTSLGFKALYGDATTKITGAYNIGIGASNGNGLTSGNYNILVGGSTGSSLSTASENVVVGHQALIGNILGSSNIAFGYQAGRYITGGSVALTNTANSIFIGDRTKALADNSANEIVIGSGLTGLGSNTVVIGNSSITTTALRGNVGISTTSPAYKLDVVGDGRFTTGLTIDSLGTGALYSNAGILTNTDPSDINLKQNILNINNSLSKLMSLRPVSFEWKNTGELSQGFIAQEVETVLPELVGQNPGGYKGLYTTRFIPYIVSAIQEQQSLLQGQRSLLDSLSFNVSNSLNISSLNKLVSSGGLEVSGHVAFGEDSVGEAEIIAGDLETRITFSEDYLEKPIITITPKSDLVGSYWVSDVDSKGFIIKLKQTQTENISFYWHAFAKKGDFFPVPEPIIITEPETPTETPTETPVIIEEEITTTDSEVITEEVITPETEIVPAPENNPEVLSE